MAALLTRRCSDIKETTKLMDECKALGIPTLGPDVNESFTDFGVNAKGEIRFGLTAIKGMSTAAANAIIEEREANGPYADLYDFLERVPSSSMNRKALEVLSLAGAFDCFGIQREQYLAPSGKYNVFLDAISQYMSQYQNAKHEAENSLFGGFDSVEISKPKPTKAQEWSAIEKLNRERDLVGIYLSAHPLDEFSVVMECLCNTKCSEIGREADMDTISKRETITVGGIVTNVREMFTKRGTPMGVVTIEDFDGSGEQAFFDKQWAQYKGMFTIGSSIFMRMKCEERYRGTGQYSLNVYSVEFMRDVADKYMSELTIHIDLSAFESTKSEDGEEGTKPTSSNNMLADLATIIKEAPGTTQLHFSIRDTRISSQPIEMTSHSSGVKINRRLIDFIKSNDCLKITI